MNLSLFSLALVQSALLALGQVMLKLALLRMDPFSWNLSFWRSLLLNWQFALCGLCFGTASLLWMYIIRHYPLSAAYPLVSLSFAFGMIGAIIFFHEHVDLTKWIGLILIVAGCYLISK